MKKNSILLILAIGMMSGGFYNDIFAVNATEQTAERQERILTEKDANRLIKEMEASGSTELVIPEGYTSIDRLVFYDCTVLTSIMIPDSVTSIGTSAFKGCTGLTSIDFKSVKSIGHRAFEGCSGLTSVVIPDSVISICYNTFEGCDKAKFIVPYKGMKKHLHLRHGISEDRIEVTKNANQANAWAWNDDGNIIIPEGTVSISDGMFKYRTDIKSITIPDSVTFIDDAAFRGCRGLTSIVIPDGVESIGWYAFKGCTGLKSIDFKNIKSIEQSAFNGCTGLTSIVIPDGVGSIGASAFEGCTGLKSIDFKNVKSIADWAFYGCTGLTSIDFKNVTSIGDWAFGGCTGLTSIVIPDSVTEIGDNAFAGCDNLKKICVYSDEIKQLVIDSDSQINPDIIEIIEKPKDVDSGTALYHQYLDEKAKLDARVKPLHDKKIADRENNPEFVDLAEVKSEDGQWLDRDVQKDDEERIKKKIARLKEVNERNKK